MNTIDLNTLTTKDLIDYEALAALFKQYLKDVLRYADWQADYVVTNDFENPYYAPFIMFADHENVTISGTEYMVFTGRTDFCSCGLFHLADKPPFEFYMLIDPADLTDQLADTMANAPKLYVPIPTQKPSPKRRTKK